MRHWAAKTRSKVNVWGNRNSWSLTPTHGDRVDPTEREIVVEIHGNKHDGFIFVMTPDGFYSTDTWLDSLQECFDYGKQLLGLKRKEWECFDD